MSVLSNSMSRLVSRFGFAAISLSTFCVRQKMFDEQRTALPLVRIRNAADQPIPVATYVEYQTALDLVS
jgi:hypothetical protein